MLLFLSSASLPYFLPPFSFPTPPFGPPYVENIAALTAAGPLSFVMLFQTVPCMLSTAGNWKNKIIEYTVKPVSHVRIKKLSMIGLCVSLVKSTVTAAT